MLAYHSIYSCLRITESGLFMPAFLGDELSAQGTGLAPHDPGALSFRDIERWVDLVRGFLDEVAIPRAAAGVKGDLILYYTSSDYCMTWPYIPRNLTLFSVDDYHPSWMYALAASPTHLHCTAY